MTTENQDFDIRRGEAKDINITVDNFPADRSAIEWSLAKSHESTTAILQKTEEDGITVVSEELRTMTVSISPEDTESLLAGNYYHQLKVVDASGESTIALVGQITVIDAL